MTRFVEKTNLTTAYQAATAGRMQDAQASTDRRAYDLMEM